MHFIGMLDTSISMEGVKSLMPGGIFAHADGSRRAFSLHDRDTIKQVLAVNRGFYAVSSVRRAYPGVFVRTSAPWRMSSSPSTSQLLLTSKSHTSCEEPGMVV